MSETLFIESHKGTYTAEFVDDACEQLNQYDFEKHHFIIDNRVAEIYAAQLKPLLSSPSVLRIDAIEDNKSLNRLPDYVEHLVEKKMRRNHRLVAVGGGITQDITCFLAATMSRGVDWHLFPTTLLAQADSCIGSKSCLNSGKAKNILGTFTPASKVVIDTNFLATLTDEALRSGVGEMIKVHLIDGLTSFQQLAENYEKILIDKEAMLHFILRSLKIKKRFIEEDEFDYGVRNVLNYGHTFGHAIEAATKFAIPHGLAVTIGMDLANYIAYRMCNLDENNYQAIHQLLRKNYHDYIDYPIDLEQFIIAIGKDKKNESAQSVTAFMPNKQFKIVRVSFNNDQNFHNMVANFFEGGRNA